MRETHKVPVIIILKSSFLLHSLMVLSSSTLRHGTPSILVRCYAPRANRVRWNIFDIYVWVQTESALTVGGEVRNCERPTSLEQYEGTMWGSGSEYQIMLILAHAFWTCAYSHWSSDPLRNAELTYWTVCIRAILWKSSVALRLSIMSGGQGWSVLS